MLGHGRNGTVKNPSFLMAPDPVLSHPDLGPGL